MENTPLTPKTVEGTDPGSVYTVVARSLDGYIAIRRILKYFYRLRAERFDSKPLVDVNDPAIIAAIINAGMAIRNGGTRVTGVSPNKTELCNLISMLEAVLFRREIAFIETLPEGSDPLFVKEDARIDAAKLKQALSEVGEGVVSEGSKDPFKN
jgi:hypothetical protein